MESGDTKRGEGIEMQLVGNARSLTGGSERLDSNLQ
jgi:hypothetical protein